MGPSASAADKLRQAILFLADQKRRSALSTSLLTQLPDYVAAGRYLDGWLVRDCALQTAEDKEESNPFLFWMFSHGYDAWVAEKQQRDKALLTQAGIDVDSLQGMSMQEIEGLMSQMQTNPELQRRAAALMESHPDQKAEAVARLEQM
jgi:hypothetical protein